MAQQNYYKPKAGNNLYKNEYQTFKNIDQRPDETQAAYYHRLAKVADRRLRELVDLSKQPGYENVLQWSYANAMYDLKAQFGENVTRFDKKLPTNKTGDINQEKYMARINAVKRFLNSASSTKRNIDIIYKSRANTLNAKYGTSFTWESIGKYFDSGLHKKLDRLFGSKTAMKVYATLQKKGIDPTDAVKDIDLRTTRTSSGIAKAKDKFMSKYSLDEGDLFSGFGEASDEDLPIAFR